ncbi:DNA gyrase inhibitor YacG [Polymorphum gilvum]|uniref:DNA gyrase inhibitor YacG n=1 Tax=Polymorphum gilvum (strain LMG 25793 / CGMCC 1.9160 / SL003B-26A1) TaxID=991905 RepID=F2IWU4_POLGS|nr:DNA gyrase inhibitor YacG [Polymorphum gilvum]ADZ71521.1 zinc-binding protein [Polymorphum gilvum SL003B-26A1]
MAGEKKNSEQDKRRMRPCPICSKLSTLEHYPFCSDRCAKIDLNRWLSESYTIPVVETDDAVPDED